MRRTASVLGVVLALSLGLAACETATPYQPLAAGNAVSGGFTDQKLDDTHYRVVFQGNSATSREQVENYLLYRAAELTVNQGFDWFEMVDRRTNNQGYAYVVPQGPYYWSPYWRFWGQWGWNDWDPYWGGPWGYDVQTVDRYQAIAEIGLGHGHKSTDNARALDARSVMQNLGPQIVKPN
jgi:hypothetical protein